MTVGERIVIYLMATIILLTYLIMNPAMARTYTGRVGRCDPGTPITISSGGTYTGCYLSRKTDVAAVTITTTAAVTLSRAVVHHKGQGVRAVDARVNLTIQDSRFVAMNPGTPTDQADLYSFAPAALTVENNLFTHGHGILINGNNQSTTPFSISKNDFVDVGRYDQPSCCIGAIHLDKVLAADGVMSWNRAVNTYGQSVNEDVISVFESNGASGDPIVVDHNLINGSYPYSGNGSGFTGSGINLGDGSGQYQVGDTNTVVNSANNGVMFGGGSDLTHTNSKVVSDGKAGINDSGTTVSSTFGVGVVAFIAGNNLVLTNNQSGHRRWNGGSFEAADFLTTEADTVSGNTSISPVNAAAEQAAVDAWETSRVSNGVTVGPR